MRLKLTWLLFLFVYAHIAAQQIDADLLKVKDRLERVTGYSAQVELEEDIDFINMPVKKANIEYRKDQSLEITSDDFVLIPKRGLDLSFSSLFLYEFISVSRGENKLDDKIYKLVSIIPNDVKADFSLANLYLDLDSSRIAAAEINTKNEGTYWLRLTYRNNEDLLPEMIEVTFNLTKLRIPFNFMGKDTTIDRKSMRQAETKEGRVFLRILSYSIEQQ